MWSLYIYIKREREKEKKEVSVRSKLLKKGVGGHFTVVHEAQWTAIFVDP